MPIDLLRPNPKNPEMDLTCSLTLDNVYGGRAVDKNDVRARVRVCVICDMMRIRG